ncbi:MAG: nitronate monooxygenase [Syntrophomonas sp.]|uniref:NAD(P)H-dependent flavin oxidoreductase n=1 Tax=Syntrophomonas sp. TaxID=2053627 RepID=UPI00260AE146|nr:nitronate monooxygenase [Syntrophomonas sp.]MDD4625616.1 nitronate monooxygenase [Syntrophomonas sp.]
MQLPTLRIAEYIPRFPIVQGGMSVRVSTASLASAVARAGGIGVIGATGISLAELKEEIRQARSRAEGGILGVNIMFAARQFAELVKTAIDEKIDIIFTGAGFSRDIFRWVQDSTTAVVPIVSSAKAARLAEKSGAPAVVAEGSEAGGHLGTDRSIKDILPEIVETVKIPVIAAGGIVDGKDMADMVKLGASGIQMATRFVLSEECSVADEYKQLYLEAREEDVIIIKSPVGMPGRALKNKFAQLISEGNAPEPEYCDACLKNCSADYCILQALNHAHDGQVDDGVVFAGQNVFKIKEILPVSRIFAQILAEYTAAK